MRKDFGHFAREAAVLRVMFEHSEITLDIPVDGLVTREGWRITPVTYPTVSETFYWYCVPPYPITVDPC